MAKRKKKSKKSNISSYAIIVIAFCVIATVVMAFLSNVKFTPVLGEAFSVNGFEVAFGWKDSGKNIAVEWSSFSIMALLAYLLPVGGLVTAVLFKKSKALSVIPVACFVAGAVLAFLIPEFLILTDAGKLATALTESSLGFGAIIAGSLNAVSAIAVAVKIFLD